MSQVKKTTLVISAIIILGVVLFIVGKETYDWLDSGKENNALEKSDNTNNHIVDVIPNNDEENDNETTAEAKSLDDQTYFITQDDFASFEEKGLNQYGEDITQEELTDESFQEYIHGMSHQKVRAEKKWGFYENHPIRIDWLLERLDQTTVQHASVYRQILEKWSKGDFQTA